MSIPVDVAELAETLSGFGPGYLLTTSDGRIKAVTVEPTTVGGVLVLEGPGSGSCGNAGRNPLVTLVFPPIEPRGYTLIVDGEARVAGDDVTVTPTHAVLHRPAAHADGPVADGGCGQDCTPVGQG